MFYNSLRSLLFRLDPEAAHELTLHLAALSPTLGKLSGLAPHPRLSVGVGNTQWNFPIGLAAGLDKNAQALPFFSAQGFGSIECGTITLRPQSGNPRPRVFRYPQQRSLRNAMGFPNQGLEEIKTRLKNYQGQTVIGANIGKNKDTSPQASIGELASMLRALENHADYFVINVSSPNTPGLRAMQEAAYLRELFSELRSVTTRKDLYLKIAPDLLPEKIIELTHLAASLKLKGLIATNTTIMPELGAGGVSGELLKQKANKVRSIILNEATDLELIGVGGISSFQDLLELWQQGGKAAQVYTSYIYQGPQLLTHIAKNILAFLDAQQVYGLDEFFSLPLAERKKRITDLSPRS
ncbi:MAG TPA: quinone-dependent dihydroorotate dehydrogenase [Bacteriovoracaceae bacterium]|nr:quinone-dependent dihydroorotate dehydrogenase [Bacteriovoracaceae bacterium]